MTVRSWPSRSVQLPIDEDDEELSDSADVLEADPVDVADQHRVVPVIEEDDPFN